MMSLTRHTGRTRRGGAMDANASNSGFSLIEVLIVVAIVGILSAIAYPNYADHVQKTRRVDGTLALLKEVQTLERCRSTRYSYANCSLSATASPENHYAITLQSDANTFTLKATGQGSQANDEDCKELTVNHQGTRTPSPETTSCWSG